MTQKTKSFEESLTRLDEIVRALESGEGNLDALLGLYEEGIGLIRTCSAQLETAEQKVKMLQMQPTGEIAAVDFAGAED